MTPAFAHEGEYHPEAIDLGWGFEPWVVIPVLLVAICFARGDLRLRRRGKSARMVSSLLFWAGLAVLALAMMSPLHDYGGVLFAAHMVEHELLMVVSVPLMVAARPAAVLLLGMPTALRRALLRLGRSKPLALLLRGTNDLVSATAVHAAVLWLWHAPFLFEAALRSEAMHVVQHLSFIVSAIFFWRAVLDRDQRRYGEAGAALALFVTSLQASLLGALITFSPRLWYSGGPDPLPIFGVTRMEDQALAGVIMWVPACAIYVIAALILLARWLTRIELRHA